MDRRPTARRAALLLTTAYALGHLLGSPDGAYGVRPATPEPTPSSRSRPPSSCTAEALPRTAPSSASAAAAAEAVLACLKVPAPGSSPRGGATLRADTLTLTGLRCGIPWGDPGECRAERVALDGAWVSHPGPAGQPGFCTRARHITFSGDVRLRADRISGHVFGLLPLTLSTATAPPVPLPHLRMTDVKASGLWSRAAHATTRSTHIAPGGTGRGDCPN